MNDREEFGIVNTDYVRLFYDHDFGQRIIQYMKRDNRNVSDSIINGVKQFDEIDGVYCYVRENVIKGSLFRYYTGAKNGGDRYTWDEYNVDPWNRQFPYFIDRVTSDYYNTVVKSEINLGNMSKSRYGYYIFYNNKMLCSTSPFDDLNDNELYNTSGVIHQIPSLVLTTTSINKKMVMCLDVIDYTR